MAALAFGPASAGEPAVRAQSGAGVVPGQRLDNLSALFAALRRCWRPPEMDRYPGMQVTVRFSLTRHGEMNGEPRVTYMKRDATAAVRTAYRRAAAAALARCVPLPLSPAFGAAIAGRPLTIRFIDNRGINHADNRQRSQI
jgi:hypothetical protein